MTDSVAKMEIGENGNHISAISFGDTAEVFMDFNTITGARLTRTAIINSLSNFTKRGGLTRIDLALLKADTDVFTEANGMRVSGEIRKVGFREWNINVHAQFCSHGIITISIRQPIRQPIRPPIRPSIR